MNVIIQRRQPNETCMFGELTIDYGTRTCYTLERLPSDPAHPAIPAGEYQASVYVSPHLKRQVLLLHGVPGRSEIEIHNGNYVQDSHGCIIVGLDMTEEGRAVLQSISALAYLISRAVTAQGKGETVRVVVRDAA